MDNGFTPVTMDPGFFPDAARALMVDAAVRCRLADSLSAAFASLDGNCLQLPSALHHLLLAIRAHRVRPAIMALYGDLMPAILNQNETALAAIINQLALPEYRAAAAHRVVTLDDAELGSFMVERYLNHIQDDPENLVSMSAIDERELADGRRRISSALTLLEQAAPALYAEINTLVSEIILVKNVPRAGELQFHGASSFFIWGALVLNLREHSSRVKMVEGIVHEAAHSLLHGLTLGGPMTKNETSERHASPLREDRRPMEGLVHAAYVLARMHFAMGALMRPELLAAGHIAAAEQVEAAQKHAAAANSFRDAAQTIAAHGALTPAGKAVFAGARSYMDAAPA